MTREEKLQQAADNFSEVHKYEENLDFLSLRMAFEEGVAWADRNPHLSSLWHDASEEPEYENKDILFYSEEYKEWSAKKPKELISYYLDSWSDVVEEYGIVQWAYITDLLPKGGKL